MNFIIPLFILFTASCSYIAKSDNHDFYRSMKEGMSCEEGSVRTGYTQPSALKAMCKEAQQVCVNGIYVGPTLFPSCDVINKNCGTLLHGQSKTAYTSPKAPCVKETHTCINGLIQGPLQLYDFCK